MMKEAELQILKLWYRRIIRSRLRHLSSSQIAAKSRAICKRLTGLPAWKKSEKVLIFRSLKSEPDTSYLFKLALRSGKRVFAPRTLSEGHAMEIREIKNFKKDFVKGTFGIPEPSVEKTEKINLGMDLMVIPGLAFDDQGRRLGRGLGYFDRFLKTCRKSWKVGVAFKEQRLDRVPAGRRDVKMDQVIFG